MLKSNNLFTKLKSQRKIVNIYFQNDTLFHNHMGIHFEICLVYYLPILYKVKKVTRLNFYFVRLFVIISHAHCAEIQCINNQLSMCDVQFKVVNNIQSYFP